MRELRTISELLARGITRERMRWAVETGRWTVVIRGVLGRGAKEPSRLDVARATAYVVDGVAHGLVASQLLNFDGVAVGAPEVFVDRRSRTRRAGIRRVTTLPSNTVVIGQVRCTNAADTLFELAARLDDDHWEQALEFCLRKSHITREQVDSWSHGRTVAARRVRRVIDARGGLDIPHTDSLLETLAVQLIRGAELPTPTRQHAVFHPTGRLIAHVDLSWPELGIFLELDGQQHDDQPVYDARRQTEVTAVTGWRCGRLAWDEVNLWPESTARLLKTLLVG